jgi:hypothetical protein
MSCRLSCEDALTPRGGAQGVAAGFGVLDSVVLYD